MTFPFGVGFSVAGALLSFAVLAPNLLLLVLPPRDRAPVRSAGGFATALERIGQAACLVLPALAPVTPAPDGWFIGVVVAIAAYWSLWGRYLQRGRSIRDLYGPVLGVPVPMAILPVVAFALIGAWLASVWLLAAAAVLAAGHLPNSVAAWRGLERETVDNLNVPE